MKDKRQIDHHKKMQRKCQEGDSGQFPSLFGPAPARPAQESLSLFSPDISSPHIFFFFYERFGRRRRGGRGMDVGVGGEEVGVRVEGWLGGGWER